jgi:hypothetical protein
VERILKYGRDFEHREPTPKTGDWHKVNGFRGTGLEQADVIHPQQNIGCNQQLSHRIESIATAVAALLPIFRRSVEQCR